VAAFLRVFQNEVLYGHFSVILELTKQSLEKIGTTVGELKPFVPKVKMLKGKVQYPCVAG
jgi:hypothetical protein